MSRDLMDVGIRVDVDPDQVLLEPCSVGLPDYRSRGPIAVAGRCLGCRAFAQMVDEFTSYLSPEDQELFNWIDLESRELSEVAGWLKTTPNALNTRTYVIHTKLRWFLAGKYPELAPELFRAKAEDAPDDSSDDSGASADAGVQEVIDDGWREVEELAADL